jgi:hypothetical protein
VLWNAQIQDAKPRVPQSKMSISQHGQEGITVGETITKWQRKGLVIIHNSATTLIYFDGIQYIK